MRSRRPALAPPQAHTNRSGAVHRRLGTSQPPVTRTTVLGGRQPPDQVREAGAAPVRTLRSRAPQGKGNANRADQMVTRLRRGMHILCTVARAPRLTPSSCHPTRTATLPQDRQAPYNLAKVNVWRKAQVGHTVGPKKAQQACAALCSLWGSAMWG